MECRTRRLSCIEEIIEWSRGHKYLLACDLLVYMGEFKRCKTDMAFFTVYTLLDRRFFDKRKDSKMLPVSLLVQLHNVVNDMAYMTFRRYITWERMLIVYWQFIKWAQRNCNCEE